MLEQKALWLGPWVANAEIVAPGGRRAIRDPASNANLGAVRRLPPTSPLGLRWLARARLEVVETDDESLLFTARQGFWKATWVVEDADGRLVGSVTGQEALDQQGRLLGGLSTTPHGLGRLLYEDGRELASWSASAGGLLLNFGELLDNNPFARMVLLAALIREGAEA